MLTDFFLSNLRKRSEGLFIENASKFLQIIIVKRRIFWTFQIIHQMILKIMQITDKLRNKIFIQMSFLFYIIITAIGNISFRLRAIFVPNLNSHSKQRSTLIILAIINL